MVKNWMKITKTTFWGKIMGECRGGGNSIFLVVGGSLCSDYLIFLPKEILKSVIDVTVDST